MMKFSDIQERLLDLYASRYEPEGVRVLADIYWRSLLVSACLTLLLAFSWGIFDLFGVLNTFAASPQNTPTPAPAFSRSTLKDLVKGFEEHRVQFESLSTTPLPKIPDPSK